MSEFLLSAAGEFISPKRPQKTEYTKKKRRIIPKPRKIYFA